MKNNICPKHKLQLKKSRDWTPPIGIDNKMIRQYCPLCSEYWYYSPKIGRISTKEFNKRFEIKEL